MDTTAPKPLLTDRPFSVCDVAWTAVEHQTSTDALKLCLPAFEAPSGVVSVRVTLTASTTSLAFKTSNVPYASQLELSGAGMPCDEHIRVRVWARSAVGLLSSTPLSADIAVVYSSPGAAQLQIDGVGDVASPAAPSAAYTSCVRASNAAGLRARWTGFSGAPRTAKWTEATRMRVGFGGGELAPLEAASALSLQGQLPLLQATEVRVRLQRRRALPHRLGRRHDVNDAECCVQWRGA